VSPDLRLASLHVYPLKSAGGIALPAVRVDETGLEHDRRWMIVDAHGAFLTQRSHARMALLRTALDAGRLCVTAPGIEPLDLPLAPAADAPHELVSVWDKDRGAVSCGREAAEWATEFLATPCRIVRAVTPMGLPRVTERGTLHEGFADGFPALVISTASLADLNARLSEPLPMNRFRPNLVVEGAEPYAEDHWVRAWVGDVLMRGRKRCFRCAITTTDQETAERGVEPLRTLATYRRAPSGEVAFGMNLSFEGGGTLCVGDRVGVEESTPS
jgi:hypothetical protein